MCGQQIRTGSYDSFGINSVRIIELQKGLFGWGVYSCYPRCVPERLAGGFTLEEAAKDYANIAQQNGLPISGFTAGTHISKKSVPEAEVAQFERIVSEAYSALQA